MSWIGDGLKLKAEQEFRTQVKREDEFVVALCAMLNGEDVANRALYLAAPIARAEMVQGDIKITRRDGVTFRLEAY